MSSTVEELQKRKKEYDKLQEEEKKNKEKNRNKMISEDGTLASFGFSDNYQADK